MAARAGVPWREAGGRRWGLRPYPADALRAFPVSDLVNDPRNDGPECLAAG
jgi:putative SOS response-associated peptidase YedK